MYRLNLYRAGELIKQSKPMDEQPSEKFIEHSRFLWPAADRHEVVEEEQV